MNELAQEILAKLDRTSVPDSKFPDRKGEYWARCVFHHDEKPTNFSYNPEKNCFKCLSCGAEGHTNNLAKKLGLEWWHGGTVDRGDRPPSPLTLEEYAKAKQLPKGFLESLGLTDFKYRGNPAVRMPYYDESGNESSVRFRLALTKGEADNRFVWRKGDKAILYGLWRLALIKKAGWVLLVEGESDCHTLWFYGIPALGIPGGTNWKAEWLSYFGGLDVYVWQEPDQAGATCSQKVSNDLPEVKVISAPEGRKDISECHLLGDDVLKMIEELKENATPYEQLVEAELIQLANEAKTKALILLMSEDILGEAIKTLQELGLVGEGKAAKLLFLAVTSRLQPRPVSIAVKGPSSAGKSFTVESVLKLFPGEAYYALSSMSERALAYSREPLKHRFLVLYEAAGLASEFATYLIRTLLSEGCIRYETVEKTNNGLEPKLIEREGPTGLIVTTTRTSLHPENETRLFSITVTDSPNQTKSILASLARRANGSGNKAIDLDEWHALQTYLAYGGIKDVNIPYAETMAELANHKAVRLRRDFGAVLNLIAVHTTLYQLHRQTDENGRLIATIDDYEAVYDLVIDVLNEGVGLSVSDQTRETVETVEALTLSDGDSVNYAELARELQIDKSAARRRALVALYDGYLKNLETKKGRPAKLRVGDPLPERENVLPDPETLKMAYEGGEGSIPPNHRATVPPPEDDVLEGVV